MYFSCKNSSADEEAGEVGPNEDDEDNAGQGDNLHQGTGEVKVETSNQRQSLTHRISSLYETLISKTAPKKSAGASAGIGNAAVDIDAKVKEIQKNKTKKLTRHHSFWACHVKGRSDRLRRIGFEITGR